MRIDYQLSLATSDVFGQGILKLVSEKSGKNQGILLSIVCGNPDITDCAMWPVLKTSAKYLIPKNLWIWLLSFIPLLEMVYQMIIKITLSRTIISQTIGMRW